MAFEDGMVPLGEISTLTATEVADGVQTGLAPLTPIDLSERSNSALKDLFDAYVKYFSNNLSIAEFNRDVWVGYDLESVLNMWQFASAIHYASPIDRRRAVAEADSYFGGAQTRGAMAYRGLVAGILLRKLGAPSYYEELSLTDLMDEYADLLMLDEKGAHAASALSWGDWIVEKGRQIFDVTSKGLRHTMKAVGWIVGVGDLYFDAQIEQAKSEIRRRIRLHDDDVTYEWVLDYFNTKYGEEPSL